MYTIVYLYDVQYCSTFYHYDCPIFSDSAQPWPWPSHMLCSQLWGSIPRQNSWPTDGPPGPQVEHMGPATSHIKNAHHLPGSSTRWPSDQNPQRETSNGSERILKHWASVCCHLGWMNQLLFHWVSRPIFAAVLATSRTNDAKCDYRNGSNPANGLLWYPVTNISSKWRINRIMTRPY